jgi:hypothetical protein
MVYIPNVPNISWNNNIPAFTIVSATNFYAPVLCDYYNTKSLVNKHMQGINALQFVAITFNSSDFFEF